MIRTLAALLDVSEQVVGTFGVSFGGSRFRGIIEPHRQ
jgi:hypothetical protein